MPCAISECPWRARFLGKTSAEGPRMGNLWAHRQLPLCGGALSRQPLVRDRPPRFGRHCHNGRRGSKPSSAGVGRAQPSSITVVYKCSLRKQVLGHAGEKTRAHPASTWPPARPPAARASCQSMIPVPFNSSRSGHDIHTAHCHSAAVRQCGSFSLFLGIQGFNTTHFFLSISNVVSIVLQTPKIRIC